MAEVKKENDKKKTTTKNSAKKAETTKVEPKVEKVEKVTKTEKTEFKAGKKPTINENKKVSAKRVDAKKDSDIHLSISSTLLICAIVVIIVLAISLKIVGDQKDKAVNELSNKTVELETANNELNDYKNTIDTIKDHLSEMSDITHSEGLSDLHDSNNNQ